MLNKCPAFAFGEFMTDSEKFNTAMIGWKDGIAGRMQNLKFSNHEDPEFARIYLEGYTKGHTSRKEAASEFSDKFGYKPSILRDADGTQL